MSIDLIQFSCDVQEADWLSRSIAPENMKYAWISNKYADKILIMREIRVLWCNTWIKAKVLGETEEIRLWKLAAQENEGNWWSGILLEIFCKDLLLEEMNEVFRKSNTKMIQNNLVHVGKT